MTSVLARKAGLKLFEKHLQKYEPKDPVYENFVDEKGRQKRRRVRFFFLFCVFALSTVYCLHVPVHFHPSPRLLLSQQLNIPY